MAWDAALRFGGHADRRANLAGSAIAVLETVVINERLLQRMQSSIRSETFQGGDGAALILHGQR
jgi:hypothetical protein